MRKHRILTFRILPIPQNPYSIPPITGPIKLAREPIWFTMALRQQAAFRGMVYIFVRLVMLNEKADKHFYEVWVPLK